MLLIAIISAASGSSSSGGSGGSACSAQVEDGGDSDSASTNQASSGNASIDSFVKEHEDAYIESWGAGGFLPSASIAQTMAEVSFSQSVPSFGQAHNMGGVKWTSTATYPKTIEKYGSDAVSGGGPGTNVGDNTGGGYTYFKDFANPNNKKVGALFFESFNARFLDEINFDAYWGAPHNRAHLSSDPGNKFKAEEQ